MHETTLKDDKKEKNVLNPKELEKDSEDLEFERRTREVIEGYERGELRK
jgi:hypothetical protein